MKKLFFVSEQRATLSKINEQTLDQKFLKQIIRSILKLTIKNKQSNEKIQTSVNRNEKKDK